MKERTIGYQPHLDGLRAVAIILVIAFHLFPRAVAGGFVGVDIFFVISGFLISALLMAEFSRPGAPVGRIFIGFYARRVRRIFPALIVLLAAVYALGFLTLMPSEFKRLGLHIAASAGFWQNWQLAGESGYFGGDAAAKPLLHIWSLGIEEQFYLLWPFVIWLGTRGRIRLLPVVVFLAGCSFWCGEYHLVGLPARAFFLPSTRFWELLIGALAATIDPSLSRASRAAACSPRWADGLAAAGATAVGLGLGLITNRQDVPNALTLLPTLGTALIICAGETAWINRFLLARRPLVGLGLISYPLYLWHWPLLSFARIVLGSRDGGAVELALVALSVGLAWLTYALIEQPLRRCKRPGPTAVVLLAAMLVVGGGGYYAMRRNGFPARFPPVIRELSDQVPAMDPDARIGAYFLLDARQDETSFRRDETEIDRGKPTIFIWGDSHADALYPGYQASFGARYNIVERTAAGVPPLLGTEIPLRPNGRRINQYIFASIVRDPPAMVVLAGNWTDPAWKEMAATITRLQAAGIRRIVLVGPTPRWVGSLPEQLFNYSRRHHFSPLPARLKTGLDQEPERIDPAMAALADRLGVEYISPLRLLENQDGVMTRVGETTDTLLMLDADHLSVAASKYLVAHFPRP